PKEDPGAIKTASHFFTSSVSSSFSKFFTASCNSLMDDHGGVGFWLLLSKKGPLGSNLNRNAPIRLSSYTPNKKSISYSVLAFSPFSLASCASRRFIKVRPQVSGMLSRNTPKFSLLFGYCGPL